MLGREKPGGAVGNGKTEDDVTEGRVVFWANRAGCIKGNNVNAAQAANTFPYDKQHEILWRADFNFKPFATLS